MPKSDEMLFKLLQIAIGQLHSLDCSPSKDDWVRLFYLAEAHSVLGVCFLGIQKLPKEQKPFATLYYKWLGIVTSIHERNEFLNEQVIVLNKILYSAGFRSCFLKGQGNAIMYGSIDKELSLLRQSGDIDVWVDGAFKDIFDYVLRVSPTDEVNEYHIQFKGLKGVPIELHYRPAISIFRLANRNLQKWFNNEKDRQMCHYVEINKNFFAIPTYDFNLVYQMLHLHRHFFSEGVGIRHLFDYYVLIIVSNLSEIEKNAVKSKICTYELDGFASALMWVLGYMFRLDENLILWKPNKRKGLFLLKEIMQTGNMGVIDKRFSLKNSKNRFLKFLYQVKSKSRFVSFFPKEALWIPIDMFLNHLNYFLRSRQARHLIKMKYGQ